MKGRFKHQLCQSFGGLPSIYKHFIKSAAKSGELSAEGKLQTINKKIASIADYSDRYDRETSSKNSRGFVYTSLPEAWLGTGLAAISTEIADLAHIQSNFLGFVAKSSSQLEGN